MRSRLVVVLFGAAFAATGQPATDHLTLTQAEQTAMANNPAVSSAQFTARAAGQVPLEYASNFKPTVTGVVTGVGADSGSRLAAGAINNPTVYSRLAAGLTLNQLVTDFGRTSNLVASAKSRAAAEDQNALTVRAEILLQVDRAYFNLLRSQSVLTVAKQTVAARQLLSDQVTKLAENKLKSQLDVSFANVNLAQAKIDLAGAENDVRAANAQLASAMAVAGQPQFTVAEEPMPEAPPDKIDGLIRDAIQQRPELANLRLEENAAQRFLEAEKDLKRPTISVIGAAGVVPAGEAIVPREYGAIGANVSIPILNGGLFKARQNEAQLRALAANRDVQDLQNRVMRDVKVAYLEASTAYQKVGLTAQLLEQARLSLNLAEGRYRLGLSSIVELSQAQLNYTAAQIASASAKYDYQTQHSFLQFQVGALR
jgi:outer membrane protein